MATRRKTAGRRAPFSSCGHIGYGNFCHRCDQGNELLERVKLVQAETKNMVAGTFAHNWTKKIHEGFWVKAGGKGFVSEKLETVVASMKEYARHLLPSPKSLEKEEE